MPDSESSMQFYIGLVDLRRMVEDGTVGPREFAEAEAAARAKLEGILDGLRLKCAAHGLEGRTVNAPPASQRGSAAA